MVRIVLFALISFLAGAVNGFLGTGGGILLLFGLNTILRGDKKDSFAASLCATVSISAIALFSYAEAGNVDFELMKLLWLPTALGGLGGAYLVDKLKPLWLTRIFAVLVIYSGACMILR